VDDEAAAPRNRSDDRDGRAPRRRPPGVGDELVEAIGKASEAFEYLERARGHLFSLHQLIGRADFLFGDAADLLEQCGHDDDATALRRDIVGRNVLDGRWTFQIVEEFDDLYYGPVRDEVRRLEEEHLGGVRHLFESEMKESRRSPRVPGHEVRPPAAHADTVEIEPPS
jgi:hypothetical protein